MAKRSGGFDAGFLAKVQAKGLTVTEKFTKALTPAPEPAKRASKFNNVKVPDPMGGKAFDSIKESKHASQFRILLKAGKIASYSRQVEFWLGPGFDGKPVVYVADHDVMNLDGTREVFDTKGAITDEYKKKRDAFVKRLAFHRVDKFTEIHKDGTRVSWPK